MNTLKIQNANILHAVIRVRVDKIQTIGQCKSKQSINRSIDHKQHHCTRTGNLKDLLAPLSPQHASHSLFGLRVTATTQSDPCNDDFCAGILCENHPIKRPPYHHLPAGCLPSGLCRRWSSRWSEEEWGFGSGGPDQHHREDVSRCVHYEERIQGRTSDSHK